MKLNIANPPTGANKLIEIDDDRKLRIFYDQRLAAEVPGDGLGDEFKGYIFKITGGNDKQGFPMKQGVLVNGRVRLLMGKGSTCYRQKKAGERKRKSVRGAIVGHDIAALSLSIVKKGDGELPGLTDKVLPRRLGPKRASKIRKLFNLSKQDDVRKYVIRREIPAHEGKDGKMVKARTKAPKIQRLVTPERLQRKRRMLALKKRHAAKSREEAQAYAKLLAQRRAEQRTKRQSIISKRRESHKKELAEKKDKSLHDKVAHQAAAVGASKPAAKVAAKPAAAKPAAAKVAAKPVAAAKPAAKVAAVAKPAAAAKPAAKVAAAAKPAAKPAAPKKK